ncbi:MAG: Hpt domain-containing protein [Leptolyngbya sp. PLA1]|nr:Hpt domain-containing protein [Leptolyngbya sp. PLA1]
MQPSTPGQPLRSQLANDPDMQELIGLFIEELPERLRAIECALAERRADDVKRVAHQLRGACGGYGFPVLGVAAGKVEDAVRAMPSPEANLADVKAGVEELVDLCRRVVR